MNAPSCSVQPLVTLAALYPRWLDRSSRGEGHTLDILVFSRPRHVVRPQWLGESIVFHGTFLLLIIAATRAEVRRPEVVAADTTLLFLPRLPPPPVLPAGMRDRAVGLPGGGAGGEGQLVLTVNPPPKGFQTVLAPTDVPAGIPAVDPAQRAFDPADFTGRGVEGGVGYGVRGGTGTVDPDVVPIGDTNVVYPATLADVRFEPAVLISQPAPKYPPVLEQAGVSGLVKLRFVVDTTGRVEARSIKVLESTHQGFEGAARESVAAAVFHPARIGQRPVRQLAHQPIRFVVAQRQ
jgi:TonB family protein